MHKLVLLQRFFVSIMIFVFWQGQIKLKETALETSTNSFLEKERDLQNKIEDLESKVEELNQAIPFQKVCDSVLHVIHHKMMLMLFQCAH